MPARNPGPWQAVPAGLALLVGGGLAFVLFANLWIRLDQALGAGSRLFLDPLGAFLVLMAVVAGVRVWGWTWQAGARREHRPVLAGKDEIRILGGPGEGAGAGEGPGEGSRPSPSYRPLESPVCEYCRCAIARAERVDCLVCETPHHRDCWEEGVGCTTYGCRGTEAVRRSTGVG